MARAIAISRDAVEAGDAAPFAAVVVKDRKIVGEGVNRVVDRCDPTSHGEVEAIRDACGRLGTWDLSGADLYTTCEPCEMCVAAMFWARIARVFYANRLEDAEAIGFDLKPLTALVCSRPDGRAIPHIPLMREEAHAVLTDWASSPGFNTFQS